MIKYNLDKLVKIHYHDFMPAYWYSYKKEKRFFGIVIQKCGIYENILGDYIGFDIPENHTLEGFVIYENPKVILSYENDEDVVYYFENFMDAKKFADKISNNGRWHCD